MDNELTKAMFDKIEKQIINNAFINDKLYDVLNILEFENINEITSRMIVFEYGNINYSIRISFLRNNSLKIIYDKDISNYESLYDLLYSSSHEKRQKELEVLIQKVLLLIS